VRHTLVLCYHAVSRDWQSPLAVRPEQLEEQLDFLVRRGYRGATFTEAVTAPPTRRTLAVTFDDGFRSVIEEAAPILDGLGLRATVFVPTRWPEDGGPMTWSGIEHWASGPHQHELASLSWPELRSLADAGWEVGSHTHSHPHLPELDDRRLLDELTRSRLECEQRLGLPCRSIAYPYGERDRRVVRATAVAGYVGAATPPVRLGLRRPLEWPRVGVWRGETFSYWRQKTAPARGRLAGSQSGERLLRWDRRVRGLPLAPTTGERAA
jgi:peptidoglycan/xylan/chitin deacetylase (PgdA/CDA1 family)